MAQLAKKRLRQKLGELELALEGRVEEHHRFILEMGAAYLDASDARRVGGNLIRRLERLGYEVTLTPRAPEPVAG